MNPYTRVYFTIQAPHTLSMDPVSTVNVANIFHTLEFTESVYTSENTGVYGHIYKTPSVQFRALPYTSLYRLTLSMDPVSTSKCCKHFPYN